jgi:hypothetical protein
MKEKTATATATATANKNSKIRSIKNSSTRRFELQIAIVTVNWDKTGISCTPLG